MTDIVQKRRFHDFWAFALYVICLITFIAIGYLFGNSGATTEKLSLNSKIFAPFALNIFSLVALNILVLFGFRFAPKFTIYASLILTPIFEIALLIAFPSVTLFIFTMIFLIGFIFIFQMIRRDIKIICAVIKSTTTILISNLFATLSVYFWMVILCGALTGIISMNYKVKEMDVFAVFLLFWTFGAFSYLFDVFAASVIVSHIEVNADESNENLNVSSLALKNTFYALGSVFLGSLIIALVQTLRYMHNNSRSNSDRERSGAAAILMSILFVIVSIFLAFLEAIVECINRFTFPYLAVKGTSYKNSVIESHELISQASYPASTWMAVEYTINILSIVGTLIFGLTNTFYILFILNPKSSLDFESSVELQSSIIFGIFSSILFTSFVRIVSSGSLGLIYTHMTMPSKVEKYDLKLTETISNGLGVYH